MLRPKMSDQVLHCLHKKKKKKKKKKRREDKKKKQRVTRPFNEKRTRPVRTDTNDKKILSPLCVKV